MMRLMPLLIVFLSVPAQAEVFKCVEPVSGKTRYQPKPCDVTMAEKAIPLKPRSAIEEAQAERDLAVWQARYHAEQAEKAQQRQADYELALREAEVAAQLKGAKAQRAQAAAQFEQAREMRRSNELLERPGLRGTPRPPRAGLSRFEPCRLAIRVYKNAKAIATV